MCVEAQVILSLFPSPQLSANQGREKRSNNPEADRQHTIPSNFNQFHSAYYLTTSPTADPGPNNHLLSVTSLLISNVYPSNSLQKLNWPDLYRGHAPTTDIS